MTANLRLKLADGSEIDATMEGALSGALRDLLATGYVGNQMRIAADDSDDVEGHGMASAVRVRLYDEDDVEGHAMTLRLPNAEAARDLQKKLLAAGIVGVIVVGAAASSFVTPDVRSPGVVSQPAPAPITAPAPEMAPGLRAEIVAGDAVAPQLAPAPAVAPGLRAEIATGEVAAPAVVDSGSHAGYPAAPSQAVSDYDAHAGYIAAPSQAVDADSHAGYIAAPSQAVDADSHAGYQAAPSQAVSDYDAHAGYIAASSQAVDSDSHAGYIAAPSQAVEDAAVTAPGLKAEIVAGDADDAALPNPPSDHIGGR